VALATDRDAAPARMDGSDTWGGSVAPAKGVKVRVNSLRLSRKLALTAAHMPKRSTSCRCAETTPLMAVLVFLSYLENTRTGKPFRAPSMAAPQMLRLTAYVQVREWRWRAAVSEEQVCTNIKN